MGVAVDTLSERAAMMRESLLKSQTITDKVVSILGSFDHRLSALETAMRPTQIRTHAIRKAHENIDRTLKAAEVVLAQFDIARQAEAKILKGPHADLESYLGAIDQLRTNIRFFSTNKSFKSNEAVVSHATNLLTKAISKLEEEFKQLLLSYSKPVEPDRLFDGLPNSLRPSSDSPGHQGEPGSKNHHSDNNNTDGAVYSPPTLIPPRVLPLLHDLALQMVQAGNQQSLLRIYRDTRSMVLEESLQKLGVEKLSRDDVQKMQWEVLEAKIGNWIHFMRIAIKLLFAGERKVCDQIFEGFDSLRDQCFSEVTSGSVSVLLSFGDAIAKSKRSPEKLFVLLDMYEIMRELHSEIDTLFEACTDIRESALGLTKRLAQTAQETFGDFEEAVEKDATKTAVLDGTVHPLTSYVINYVKFLFDYQSTLKQLFQELEKGDGKQLATVTMRIMQALQTNLDGKSKQYRDPSLTHLFLMNNMHYMVRSVRRSEAKDLLGDDWVQRHRRIVQQHANQYKRNAWAKILQCLSVQGLTSSGGGSSIPNEFLTSVHGYYGSLNEWSSVFVRSLTFESNKKTYGPFGAEVGTYFSFPMTGGKIVGFHGKSGWYLDAIGVYLKPLENTNITRTLVQTHNFVANGHDKLEGFSVIQGSVGQSYDIVLAVRQKDDGSNPLAFENKLTRQNSHSKEFNDVGTRDKAKVQFTKAELPKGLAPKDVPQKEIPPRLLPPKVAGSLTFGPWGGNGGATFDDGIYKGIRQIKLSRNVGIASIKIMYDEDGEAKWGSKHGGTGGYKSDKIVFDYPSEILTHITGTMGSLMYMGPTAIKSLTFYTNKTKYGPFGEEQGPSFTSKLKDGKIVGFHGREGLFLDALGVHMVEGKVPPLTPPPPPPPSTAIVPKPVAPLISQIDSAQWSNKLVVAKGFPTEDVSCGFVKEPSPCGPGPWGGDGGRQWDDGVFSGIRQIFVTRGEAICSMQIEYDRNGQSLWSVKHGGDGGIATHRIKLEYPHEVLVCISGYYGSITKDDKPKVIRSLTFYTSRGKYGPYGEEIGTYFTSTTTEGKVVGFHGRSSMYLDAIGVHMQHWLGNQRTPKPSLFWKTR